MNKSIRLIATAGVLLLSACFVVDARAQCCGQATTSYYAPAYTSYYAPAYTSYYSPAYTSYYGSAYSSYYAPSYSGGWYPGYWWDRMSARVWGSPTAYVASYRPAYYANYGYTASYAPACSSCGGGCSTCAGYAPACSTCSTCAAPACSTCSSCTAGYAPACSSCGTGYVSSYAPACSTCASSSCGCTSCSAPCESNCGCSNCGAAAATVTQTSYQQPVYQQPSNCGCSGNSNATQLTYARQGEAAARQPDVATPPAGAADQRPNMGLGDPRTTNRPADTNPPVQPGPGSDDKGGYDPYSKKTDSSTFFEAPKLFNPNDRTASRSNIAPVRTAVYEQPVSYRHTSQASPATAAPRAHVSDAQAQIDAIGWTSGK